MTETAQPAFPPVSVHMVVKDAAAAIDFYKTAFGAEEMFRLAGSDGRLVHASLGVCGGVVMLCDDFPEFFGGKSRDPKTLGTTSVTIHLHVPDVDALWARAVAAGCTVMQPLADQFWGDRYGKLADPFGHEWSLATTIATPSPEEMQAAWTEMEAKMAAGCGQPS